MYFNLFLSVILIAIISASLAIAIVSTIVLILGRKKINRPSRVFSAPSPEMEEVLKGWATIES